MAWTRVILATLMLASVISCKNLEQKVVGRWQSEDEVQAVTFHDNGTATFESYGRTVDAQYKFTDQAHAKFIFDSPLGEFEGTQIALLTLDKEELTLEFESGLTRSYLRVKA
ncbi:MAG TPA: hypothetical protein VGL38_13620 [bacterium]|jgi:hypothetical protein